jgi:signal transduction histidine kinase
MASHEFRTPLSTILSSASLVAKYTEAEEQDKRDKHIQRIKSSVNNLTNLLNEFLSIGKIEDGKVLANNTDFNVKELISGLCIEMEALVKPGQKIICLHTGKEMIFLDPSLLRNIIINLLSNAIKFSPADTVIEVITREGYSLRTILWVFQKKTSNIYLSGFSGAQMLLTYRERGWASTLLVSI